MKIRDNAIRKTLTFKHTKLQLKIVHVREHCIVTSSTCSTMVGNDGPTATAGSGMSANCIGTSINISSLYCRGLQAIVKGVVNAIINRFLQQKCGGRSMQDYDK